tara:strand:+ start:124 stop:477 length:354 start_codon:yes stop_codon:yes gene_type:complete
MKLYITILITHVLTFANGYSKTKSLDTNYGNLFSGAEIGQYFQYPDHALSHSISGTSIIEFDVTENNNIDNVRIINSLGPNFDEVIINGLSKFSLEKLKSLNVKSGFRYRLPLKFEN